MTGLRLFSVAALWMLGALAPAQAQTPAPDALGEFGDWAAYSYKAATGKVCYVVSSPKSSDPATVKRDPIFFLITHRAGQSVRNEVSTIIGYPFKKDSQVDLRIDGEKYKLFTNGDGAWAENKDRDRQIVAAMKKGGKMSVAGTSWRGTSTVDSYSLKGISGALEKIDGACK